MSLPFIDENLLKKGEKNSNTAQQPRVKFYEGVEGLKKIYNITLQDKKPIFALTAVIPKIDPELMKWLREYYVKKRREQKIFAKVISPKTRIAEEYCKHDKDDYRKTLLIPKEKFPISIEINIFGGKVALISYKENELLGVIIESREIAKSMRVFFDLSWEKALDYQREWKNRF